MNWKQMQERAQALKKQAAVVAVGAGAAVASMGAHATGDAVTDAFTAIGTSISGYEAGLVGLAVTATTILVGVAWVKKARGAAK